MRKYFVTILVFSFCFNLWAQESDLYIIVTVEKKMTNSLHPLEFDYWVVPLSGWKESGDPFIPLYIDGFSKTDVDECCISDTLILFNYNMNESFHFDEPFLKSLSQLRTLVKTAREKAQTIKKEWSDYKEKITVYLTPVKGAFCVCELKHKDDNSKIGYYGKTAVPYGEFEINNDLKNSQELKEIRRYDFSTLPFFNLQNIQ